MPSNHVAASEELTFRVLPWPQLRVNDSGENHLAGNLPMWRYLLVSG